MAPHDPASEARVAALIGVAARLIDVIEREIETLRRMRPADIQPLQADKAALAAAYEAQVRELAAHPEALAAVAPALRREFAAVARRFNRALAENEHALHAARIANDRLIRAIAEAVAESQARFRGYSATGAAAGDRAGAPAGPVSLTFDRQL